MSWEKYVIGWCIEAITNKILSFGILEEYI